MIVTVQDKSDEYCNILWVRSLCQAETIELQPNSENSSTAVRIISPCQLSLYIMHNLHNINNFERINTLIK